MVILVHGLRRTKYNITDIVGHSNQRLSSPPLHAVPQSPKPTNSVSQTHTHTLSDTPPSQRSGETTGAHKHRQMMKGRRDRDSDRNFTNSYGY